MPLTAHFIGGCAIGDSPETGVVDPYQRVYGHPGLHVVDGSAISANLGVNPSLTITAQAERAMAFWPNKGEADPRPALGSAYERIDAGRARDTRSSRPTRPGRCGCRSSGSADRSFLGDRRNPARRRSLVDARVDRGPGQSLLPPSGRVPSSRRCSTQSPRDDQGPATSLPGRALVRTSGAALSRVRRTRVGLRLPCRDRGPRARPRPRRRLRRPVRPADRPPGARGAGLLRDRAAHDAGRRDAGPQARGDHPLRRPVVGLRRGRARRRRRPVRRRRPGLRHVLRLPGDGPGPRRRGRATPARASTAARRSTVTDAGTLLADLPRRAHGLDVATATRSPRRRTGFDVLASTDGTPVAAFEDLDRRLAGVQWHPEVLHTEHGQQVLEHFLHDIAGCRPTWTMVNIVEEQIERIRDPDRRPRPGHLRAVRRRRLGGRRGARAAGDRRPADLRLRRPRAAAQGRGRAGRARLRRRHRRRPERRRRREAVPRRAGRASPTRRRSARSSAASSSGSSRPPRPRSSATPRRQGDARSRSWCRARSTPTSWSPAAAPAPPTSSPTTTSAACPTTWSSSWSSRCAPCSRTRSGWSASSSACPPRSSGGTRSPAPAWASGSSARSTRERLDILREADAIAREELTRAGLDRDIWQFPVVLLADVRSVGVQGDGRTYGHPVVLRPVTSEDAMTADWARLPYDVLETDLDPDHQRGRARSTGSPSTSPASRPAPSSGSRRLGCVQKHSQAGLDN